MRPRGSPYPSLHANMSIINVYTATPLRVHPAGSCVSSIMIPVRPDLLIVGLGHCARVRHNSRLLRHSVPYPGSRTRVRPQTDSVSWFRRVRSRSASTAASDAGVESMPSLRFFLHTLPPPHTGVRSVHVSALRFIVVAWLTEGSVFVGNCEADGGSA